MDFNEVNVINVVLMELKECGDRSIFMCDLPNEVVKEAIKQRPHYDHCFA